MHFKKIQTVQIENQIDQGGEVQNNIFKRFLKNNNTEMYSAYNEGKSVVTERFIRTLTNKIFKHMGAVSKNVYFDVLEDIVNKYNNTVYRTVTMKLIDVTSDFYAEYNEMILTEYNGSIEKDPKFKVGDCVRISKYKSIFARSFYHQQNQKTQFHGLTLLVI